MAENDDRAQLDGALLRLLHATGLNHVADLPRKAAGESRDAFGVLRQGLLVDAWPDLPERVQEGILTLVRPARS